MPGMTYEEACEYVLDLPLHTKKNLFCESKAFYRWLGEPGSKSRILHVAGTNGKGSVCAFLHSILRCAGYRTGMFTSPHLVDLRERFRLDETQIDKETFARLFTELDKKIDAYNRLEGRKGNPYRPTFFETVFFLFMSWMEEKQPDFILLEAGMGGRLDVTNVIERPLACVITRIALDHCAYLGGTVEAIAGEKAGILKTGVPAVCWAGPEGVNEVFVKRAEEMSAPLTLVSKNQVAFSKIRKNNVDFFMESAYYRYIKACLNTEALYQAENALLAVRTLEASRLCRMISNSQVEEGLSAMRWEGRMEEVAPDVYVDGAHNPDGIAAFLRSVEADGAAGPRLLLFGASADKSVGRMTELLLSCGLFEEVAGTCFDNPRSLTKEQLAGLLPGGAKDVYEDPAGALLCLMNKRRPQERIYVTGSLYLVGEIKRSVGIGMGGMP